MNNQTAGIIGYGRFGKLLQRELSRLFETRVYDINQADGIRFSSLKEAASADYLFLCVPISKFEESVRQAKPYLGKHTIVMDVCSVKEYPVKIMKKELKNAEIIGTHPLFGPDSYSDPKNRKIALCPARANEESLKKVKEIIQKLGWTIIETTPEKHDKDMAISLTLMHVMGIVFSDLSPAEMTTMNYHILREMGERVRKDSIQLLHDMLDYNRYAKPTILQFAKEMEKWGK